MTIYRTQEPLSDGRHLIQYQLPHPLEVAKESVTVVTGSNMLATETARVLTEQGERVILIQTAMNPAPSQDRVYFGTVGSSDVWNAIAHQYTIAHVLHLAAFDEIDPHNPYACFTQIVAEGMAMLQWLKTLPPKSFVYAAVEPRVSDHLQGSQQETAYAASVHQFARQLMLTSDGLGIPFVILRLPPVVVAQGQRYTDLWGTVVGIVQKRTERDQIALGNAVDGIIRAHAYLQTGGASHVMDITLQHRNSWPDDGAIPAESGVVTPPEGDA